MPRPRNCGRGPKLFHWSHVKRNFFPGGTTSDTPGSPTWSRAGPPGGVLRAQLAVRSSAQRTLPWFLGGQPRACVKSSALKTRSLGRNKHGGLEGLSEHFGVSTRQWTTSPQVFSPNESKFRWGANSPVCRYNIYRPHGASAPGRRPPTQPTL